MQIKCPASAKPAEAGHFSVSSQSPRLSRGLQTVEKVQPVLGFSTVCGVDFRPLHFLYQIHMVQNRFFNSLRFNANIALCNCGRAVL